MSDNNIVQSGAEACYTEFSTPMLLNKVEAVGERSYAFWSIQDY